MNNSRGYDQLSYIYRLVEFIAFGHALERARFHHFAQLRDCKRILLLGDGDGRGLALACRLAPHAHIDSLDFSAGMLDHAARRLRPEDRSRVTLRQADALTADFPADTYDAVTTLFFLDCFSGAQVRAFIEHLRPALKPDALWLYADFALPPRGFFRARAQAWLALMLFFFRWQTGLTVRALPQAEDLLQATGFQRVAETAWQGGFILSAVFTRTKV
jgi:ubiquinone/menaquinone biosynthesis C-methylase UbiE